MKTSMLAVATTVATLSGADAKWEVIQEGVAQILQGVAAPTEDTVMASGATGQGFSILKSTDGGATFDGPGSLLPDIGLAFGMAAGGPEGSWDAPLGSDGAAVVAGFLNWGHSTDSLKTIDTIFDGTVRSVPDGTPFASLDVRKLDWGGDYTFGMAGLQRSVELGVGTSDSGPAVSHDGGKTWSTFSRMRNVLAYPIQHADWPTENTWYVTSGSWSEGTRREGALFGGQFDVSEHLSYRNGTAVWKSSDDLSKSANSPYGGHIHKTTDGGLTWELSLDIDTMYFNKIACRDEFVCAAASEGSSTGAGLFLTIDGGAEWKQVIDLPQGYNLQGAEWVGTERQRLVAYGGRVGFFQFEGDMYTSSDWMDGNPTFELESIERSMFTDVMGVPNSDVMYAVGVRSQNTANIMKFTPN